MTVGIIITVDFDNCDAKCEIQLGYINTYRLLAVRMRQSGFPVAMTSRHRVLVSR